MNTELIFFSFAKSCVPFSQEFYDEWPIRLGEAEPYKGPKTPDGRVRILIFLFMNLNFDSEFVQVTYFFFFFLVLFRKSTFIRLLTIFYMEKKKSKSFREYSLAACE